MQTLAAVLLITLQTVLGGCASLGISDTEVLRRYAAQTRVVENTPKVKITVFALPVPAAAPAERASTTLSPDAQAEIGKGEKKNPPPEASGGGSI